MTGLLHCVKLWLGFKKILCMAFGAFSDLESCSMCNVPLWLEVPVFFMLVVDK